MPLKDSVKHILSINGRVNAEKRVKIVKPVGYVLTRLIFV